ncbi:flagellar export chaperone FliS [Paenibacillus larvae]|uniref:flagellar export chaperone FliS n=1 Tax=Paenibacillus larvae TaxID=1464 RepID=UPI002282837B|nr:flagellar export chaperone FliS [Paenibacillus larvae]MCY7475641.1 flagellar export chaperone FliS [Paenibacillus larvae]MDE5165536.1 flagellar export chaperone FliS [Paenibacillus larvae subsp. larvae]
MIPSPYQKYQQTKAQTASPAQLLLMLYDGAIRFVKLGIEGIQEHNMEKTNTNLCKAQSILHEMIASLNFNYEISNNLLRIYEYMLHQLIQSNVNKSAKPAEEVLSQLMELKEAWTEAGKQVAGSVAGISQHG